MNSLVVGPPSIYHIPTPFLGDNNITAPIQKGVRVDEWFTYKGTSYINDLSYLLNFYEVDLYTEANSCGFIAIPVIEINFYN